MIWQWLNRDLWGPMWPNMFAPSMITLAAIIISHVRQRVHARRRHEDMKQHVTNSTGGPDGQAPPA